MAELRDLVGAALKRSTAATAVEIWFKGEARVGQKGGQAYAWAPRGSRPLMVRDNHHDSAYIFGAICPARGVGAAIITPSANTEMINLHLAEISTQVSASNARHYGHSGKTLIDPEAAVHRRLGDADQVVIHSRQERRLSAIR